MGPPLVTRQISNLMVVHFIGRLSLETKPRPTPLNAENFIRRFNQVVLVYLELFRRNSLLKCASQLEIAKKITKIPYFVVQGRSKSSMLVPPVSKSASASPCLSTTVLTLDQLIVVK